MSCRRHLGSMLFKECSWQHCDTHTVPNYDELPSELREEGSYMPRQELRDRTRTGVWDDMAG